MNFLFLSNIYCLLSYRSGLRNITWSQQQKLQSWQMSWYTSKPQSQHMERYPQGSGKPPLQENLTSEAKPTSRVPVCYQCGEEGHIKPGCPRSVAKINQVCHVPRPQTESVWTVQKMPHMIGVQVQGKEFKALIDSVTKHWCIHNVLHIIWFRVLTVFQCGVRMRMFPVVLIRDLPVLPDLLQWKQTCTVARTMSQSK